MLDADYAFAVAVNIVDLLARRSEQAPHAILVAIAYPKQYPSEERYRLNRTRDYTPWPMAGAAPGAQGGSGQAARFLRVLERDVFPYVEARYPADGADRTLVGHSYGGLFAAWVLQKRPELFRRYLIVSPSLWYNDEALLKHEERGGFAPLARRTLVYMAIGSDENPTGQPQMVDELNRFAKLLQFRRDSRLVVQHRVFSDETHASIFPVAFSTGVRHLFGEMDNRPPVELAVGTGQ
jgi:predicted alpha/beta superfamily hydrolase